MIIYEEQIPDGYDYSDYPDGTEFVLIDDTPLKRDPITFELIPREKRSLVYPEDIINGT